jgi:hypothetical protein
MYLKSLSVIVLVLGLLTQSDGNNHQVKQEIDGIYLFKSETTVPSESQKQPAIRKAPDWQGVYIFSKGVFSRTLINKKRNGDWVGFFPSNYSELGFESQTGTYFIRASTMILDIRVGLSPFDYDSKEKVTFSIQGDELVISKRLYPHAEDLRDGTETTVLTKVNADKLKEL